MSSEPTTPDPETIAAIQQAVREDLAARPVVATHRSMEEVEAYLAANPDAARERAEALAAVLANPDDTL